MKDERLEIILPNSLSEAILSLACIDCLRQLQEKYGPSRNVVIYPPDRLVEVIWALKLFETNLLEETVKLHSWFMPSDKAFFLDSSARSLGLRSKESFGYKLKGQLHANHKNHLAFLKPQEAELPSELTNFLQTKFKLSAAAIKYFGILLTLGYSTAQIKSCFAFSPSSLELKVDELNTWKPTVAKQSYLVFCTEASYGKSESTSKAWSFDNFVALAESAYNEHNLMSVFVGVDSKSVLPKDKNFLLDLRQKLSLVQVAQLMRYSKGFVGNDSGTLHLANLLKLPTTCIYTSSTPENRGPLFSELNFQVCNPTSPEAALSGLKNMLSQNV